MFYWICVAIFLYDVMNLILLFLIINVELIVHDVLMLWQVSPFYDTFFCICLRNLENIHKSNNNLYTFN